MNQPLRAVRGMNDILPDEADRWEALEALLRRWLRSYGYRNIRTPLLEHTGLFRRAIGEATDIVEKEMYSFEDALNGEQLTLRPEATASTVRAALEHSLVYGGPQRLYYFGPMFRHERPQKGRYRQFHQVGAEALGFAGPDVDAEMVIMCARLWRALGLTDVRLELNCLGESSERAAYREALVCYLESREAELDDDSRRRMRTNPLRVLDSKNPDMKAVVAEAPKITSHLGDRSRAHFDSLQATLREQGVEYRLNPCLVRGLDYYNLTVFEWVTDRLGAQGTVCAGGRYDGLFEQLGGKPQPACGWAMGMERLLALLEAQASLPTVEAPDVYLVNQGREAAKLAFRVAELLRDSGCRVVHHCGGGSFKAQMKKADASGARVAVIIGDDEAAAGEVTVKPLRDALPQAREKIESLSQAILRSKPLEQSETA
jgi:histidyl-tRNA synthetase